MDEQSFVRSLFEATEIVRRAVDEAISFQQFLTEYGNFYYEAALDAHEADEHTKMLFSKYARSRAFHEAVQTTVVDRTYSAPADQRAAYEQAGRLDHAAALSRLKEIAKSHDIGSLSGEQATKPG